MPAGRLARRLRPQFALSSAAAVSLLHCHGTTAIHCTKRARVDCFEDEEPLTAPSTDAGGAWQPPALGVAALLNEAAGEADIGGADGVGRIDIVAAAFLLLVSAGWSAVGLHSRGEPRLAQKSDDRFEDFRESWRPSAEMSNRVSAITLRFADEKQEARYAHSYAAEVCSCVSEYCCMVMAFHVFCILSQLVTVGSPIFVGLVGHCRLSFVCAVVSYSVCTGMMLILASRKAFRDSENLELVVLSWLLVQFLLIAVFFVRWLVLLRTAGHGAPYELAATYQHFAQLAIGITATMLYWCTLSALRFVFLIPVCVVPPMVYLAVMVASMQGSLGEGVLLSTVCSTHSAVAYFALRARYSSEKQRRLDWLRAYGSFRAVQLATTAAQKVPTISRDGRLLEKALGAIAHVSMVLDATLRSVPHLAVEIEEALLAAKPNLDFAKKAIGHSSKTFQISPEDALRGKEFANDKVLLAFMKSTIGGHIAHENGSASHMEVPESELSESVDAMVSSSALLRVVRVDDMAKDLGQSFEFDTLRLTRTTGGMSLIFAGERIVVGRGYCDKTGIKANRFRAFCRGLLRRYQAVAYHSEAHAAQVLSHTAWFANATGWSLKASVTEAIALFLATLAHDVGHFGRNNLFVVNTMHNASMLWNDQSVLENMHAAACFSTMSGEADVLCSVRMPMRKRIRSSLIRYILVTDMKQHHSSLAKLKAQVAEGDFLAVGSSTVEEDLLVAGEALIKAGDLGHAFLPWVAHEEWSLRVVTEFFEQGDEERALGLPISPLCDRRTVTSASFANSQAFFIDMFSSDSLQALIHFAPRLGVRSMKGCFNTGQANKDRWKEVAETFDPSTLNRELLAQLYGRPSKEAVLPYVCERNWLAPGVSLSTQDILHELVVQGNGTRFAVKTASASLP